MVVKYSNYTYYRIKGDYLYITNLLNKRERYYLKDNVEFFKVISKQPKTFSEIISNLLNIFDISNNEIISDYSDFLKDLESDGYVIIGNTISEIKRNEINFSYKNISLHNNRYPNEILNEDAVSELSNISINEDLYLENLHLEITRRCNEKCIHCYIPQNERSNGGLINIEEAKQVIDQAKELGVWQLTITGGEPFLHPQINEILKHAREKDVIIVILSNLTVLNNNHIQVLKNIYPSHIQVSLYSLNPDVHDSITGIKGSLRKTIASIEKLYKNNIPLQINCPILKLNINDINDVIDFGKNKNIRVNVDFEIIARTDYTTDNCQNSLDKTDYINILNSFRTVNNKYYNDFVQKYQNRIKNTLDKNSRICEACRYTLFVSYNCLVRPCAMWNKTIGDMKKSSLSDIYHIGDSEKIRELTFNDYINDNLDREIIPFIKFCPASFANSNNGNYFEISKHELLNSKLKLVIYHEIK